MMTVTLTISGMNCGHCVKAVTEALSGLPFVSDLQVEVGRATFRAASVPDADAVGTAIDEAGFELASMTTSA